MKKFVITLALGTLMFTSNSSLLAYASNPVNFDSNNDSTGTLDNDIMDNIQIVEDNESERVVEYTEEIGTTVAIYDKENNVLTIESPIDGLMVIDLNKNSEELLDQKSTDLSASLVTNPGVSILSSTGTVKQNTYSNYEYTITFNKNKSEAWQLRRPKNGSRFNYYYKNITRNSSNAKNLDAFQKQVELINGLELKVIGQITTATALAGISYLLAVPTAGAGTITTGLAALGITGSAANNLLKLKTAQNNAEIYYHRSK